MVLDPVINSMPIGHLALILAKMMDLLLSTWSMWKPYGCSMTLIVAASSSFRTNATSARLGVILHLTLVLTSGIQVGTIALATRTARLEVQTAAALLIFSLQTTCLTPRKHVAALLSLMTIRIVLMPRGEEGFC